MNEYIGHGVPYKHIGVVYVCIHLIEHLVVMNSSILLHMHYNKYIHCLLDEMKGYVLRILFSRHN